MFGGSLSQVSNKADWIDCVEMTDAETGVPIDLSDVVEIIMQVTYPGDYNSPLYGIDGGSAQGAYNWVGISASLSGGKIVIIQPGIFQFWFTAAQMRGLSAQTYDVGITLTNSDGIVSQLFIGTVPIVEGFVLAAKV